MANKRIRVYELARELGLSNKEALDLCERLRIGVKSHSSSIEDPQADRVRRLADAEGLRRPTQPEAEPEPAGRRAAAAVAAAAVAAVPATAEAAGRAGRARPPSDPFDRGGGVRLAPRPDGAVSAATAPGADARAGATDPAAPAAPMRLPLWSVRRPRPGRRPRRRARRRRRPRRLRPLRLRPVPAPAPGAGAGRPAGRPVLRAAAVAVRPGGPGRWSEQSGGAGRAGWRG